MVSALLTFADKDGLVHLVVEYRTYSDVPDARIACAAWHRWYAAGAGTLVQGADVGCMACIASRTAP